MNAVFSLLSSIDREVGNRSIVTQLSVVLDCQDMSIELCRTGKGISVFAKSYQGAHEYKKLPAELAMQVVAGLLAGRSSVFLGTRILSTFDRSVSHSEREEWVWSMNRKHCGCNIRTINGVIVSGESRDYVCMLLF